MTFFHLSPLFFVVLVMSSDFHREMASFSSKHYDAAATLASRRLPVESAMPGTTLGVIPMDTFAAGGTLFGALKCWLTDTHGCFFLLSFFIISSAPFMSMCSLDVGRCKSIVCVWYVVYE